MKNDTILPEQYRKLLEHTCNCTGCADRMAAIMEPECADRLIMIPEPECEKGRSLQATVLPPAYLKEQILERTKQVDVQAATAVKKTSRRVQFIMYSLRVGAAVAASIFILSITSNFRSIDFSQMEQPSITEQLHPEKEEETENRQKDTLLDKVNQATNGMAEKMNEFTNQLLKGGKKE